MKFYIAARFELKNEVREIFKEIQNKGHEITLDWTTHQYITPYDQNQEISRGYSDKDIDGVKNSDVFILLVDEKTRTGVYVELGAAISSFLEHGKPQVFIVGDSFAKSMFYFHSSINRRNSIKEVLDEVDAPE